MQIEELIFKQFPGKVLISMVEAGACIGMARNSCYNRSNLGTFPLPIRKVGHKNMVALTDIINFLNNGKYIPEQKKEEKRKPGRPTKGEQVRRMEAAREANPIF